jgi:transcription elongation factor Elf1
MLFFLVWNEEDDHIRRPGFLFFLLFFVISVFTFFLSLWDILFDVDVTSLVFILYLLLFGSAFVVFLIRTLYGTEKEDAISRFTKTLQGGLFHFQCPMCRGIFAIKESMYHGKEKTVITCPDCGHLGTIHPYPAKVIGSIPEGKSRNVLFKCLYCGESLRIWAEGTDLHPHLEIYNCPFCGHMSSLRKM